MKGIILIPTLYKGNLAHRDKAMYAKLCKRYNFTIVYSDTMNLDGYDVGIIMCTPYYKKLTIPPGLIKNNSCKLIGHFGDLQCWGNEECIKNKNILFDRYDLLIGTYYEKFLEWWPQYVHKYIHWPQYFGPYEQYTFPINKNPIMRCLMIGARTKRAYPLRDYVASSSQSLINKGRVDVTKGVPFDRYPKYLNKYFCSLALSSIFNFPEAKYFEIPAAGVLMLAREVKELSMCGLEPNIHYVPVTRKNIFEQINKVLDNPQDYIKMRDTATKFVRENYSDVNKVDSFKEIFDKLGTGIHKALLR